MVLKLKKSEVFLAHGQYHDKASSFFIQAEGTFFVFPMPKKNARPSPESRISVVLYSRLTLPLICSIAFWMPHCGVFDKCKKITLKSSFSKVLKIS
tara:strand:- start:2147 stop:2434 length:288 start_codon:yes stop_codon:yes gene_type:complete